MEEPQKNATAPAEGEESQGPEVRDLDQVQRVFSTTANQSVTEDFLDHKDFLGQVYETIQGLVQLNMDKGNLEFPLAALVFKTLEGKRRDMGVRTNMPPPEEFARYLAILAAQSPPFIHTLRELVFEGGGIKVLTRYVGANRKVSDIVRGAYRAAEQRTALMISELTKNSSIYNNWEDLFRELSEKGTPVGVDLTRDRADSIFRRLYLRTSTDNNEYRERVAFINKEIQRWIYTPLLKRLKKNNIVVVISCADIRNSGREGFERIGDLIYLNNPERIQERAFYFCQALSLPAFKQHVDIQITSQARSKLDEPREYIEIHAPMIQDLLIRIRAGMDLHPELRNVVIEAAKLTTWIQEHERQERLREELEEVKRIIQKVKARGNLVEVMRKNRPQFEEKYIRFLLEGKVPGVLACTVPFIRYHPKLKLGEMEQVFAIARERKIVGNAIDQAIELYEKSRDDFLLRVLEHILVLDKLPDDQLKEYVPPVHLVRLREALKFAYVRYLPWYSRLWVFLKGSELDSGAMAEVKQGLNSKAAVKIVGARNKNLKQDKKEAKRQVREMAGRSLADQASEVSPIDRTEAIKSIKAYLEEEWEKYNFPFKNDLARAGVGGSGFVLTSVLEELDRGGGVDELVSIPIEGNRSVYGSREYIERHRDEIIEYCERSQEETAGMFSSEVSEVARLAAGKNRLIYSAIMDYLSRNF